MNSLTAIPLGRLERVRVREAWPDEARNFTPWLANTCIAELSEEIGVPLRIIRCEHAVGRYSLDILATTSELESEGNPTDLVVIENQFGSTDHDHLGKLMTYASGVGEENQGAKTIIWISEDFREEHRRALEWLNEVTQSGVRFYGVQLELYKIGDSLTAPSFNVLVRPNEVVRARRVEVSGQTGESERSLFYIEYWTAFKEYCTNHNSSFRLQTPRPGHYLLAAIGRAGFHISFLAARRDKWIRCELYISGPDPAATFAALNKDRAAIDAEVPGLDWQHQPGAKAAKLHLRQLTPPGDRTLWPEQFEWLLKQGNRLYTTFSTRVRTLK